MRLKFERQQFQEDAAAAVVSLFKGMPQILEEDSFFTADRGNQVEDNLGIEDFDRGIRNAPWQPWVSLEELQQRVHDLQFAPNGQHLPPSSEKDFELKACPGKTLNLTIEMETGVGKTYTYIKTIHELYEAYGWRKFIVIVPSVAIREGVKKSFEMTAEHFANEYQHNLHFFVYNSQQLSEIDAYVTSSDIEVMIINSQAFNSKNKEAKIFTSVSDAFGGRAPVEVICKTNPILILDEPQSLEGAKADSSTKKAFDDFGALMILRYSATHRSVFNMVYRLDAIDAYNQHLVKKIAVKGITIKGNSASSGYVYLENVLPVVGADPVAKVAFYKQNDKGTVSETRRQLSVGDNLFDLSRNLPVYEENYVIKEISWAGSEVVDSDVDGEGDNASVRRPRGESYISFTNGITLQVGEACGNQDIEMLMRRLQIRETIATHFEREKQLFARGIKVLTLFFIDKVSNYREYDEDGKSSKSSSKAGTGAEKSWHLGRFAQIFEEEYKKELEDVLAELKKQPELFSEWKSYVEYLEHIAPERTHAGYFSRDGKKGTLTDGKLSGKGQDKISDDVSAYDLIMKDKERLLELDPERSPVRFIFTHSALREGWDNPNVFQICTLKDGGNSTIRKRQEVGRGMRLCVDQNGRRQDESLLNNEVQSINLLTVIASESYEDFANALQKEIAEDLGSRPRQVTAKLFTGMTLQLSPSASKAGVTLPAKAVDNEHDGLGVELTEASKAAPLQVELSTAMAKRLQKSLTDELNFVDQNGYLTDAFYEAKEQGNLETVLTNTWLPALSSGITSETQTPEGKAKWKETEHMVQSDPWRACAASVVTVLESVYSSKITKPKNARNSNSLPVNQQRYNSPEFRRLWASISPKSTYSVNFDSAELIDNAVKLLDTELTVTPVKYEVSSGAMKASIADREQLMKGKAFARSNIKTGVATEHLINRVTYDLVGTMVKDTDLTRKDMIEILRRIKPETFAKFKQNPEEFMKKGAHLINAAKGNAIVNHISYRVLDDSFDANVLFGRSPLQLDFNATNITKVAKHLYDSLIYDSKVEKDFALDLDRRDEVAVYVKLPSSFYINTPMGHYNPDWAIAFYDQSKNLHHLKFVAETKGSKESLQLRAIEAAKIECARKHFEALNQKLAQEQAELSPQTKERMSIGFGVVSSVDDLFNSNLEVATARVIKA